jgi:hypothetical protein
MEKVESYVQLNRSGSIGDSLVYMTPVWSVTLYFQYKKELPFMADTEPYYSNVGLSIGQMVINKIEYLKVNSVEDCLKQEKSFFQDGGKLYIHCEGHLPLWHFTDVDVPVSLGFSDGKARRIGNAFFNAGGNYKIKISKSADNLEYGKMKFNTTNIEIINTDGQYDSAVDFIGNDANVLYAVSPYAETIPVNQYFINNATIKRDLITFECKDKRERLAQKVGNEVFTLEEYPKINKDYVGKTKQEVYGYYAGVSGVCIDELDVYNEDGSEKGNRRFRFSSQITGDVEKLEIKQTQDESGQAQGERWTIIPKGGWENEGDGVLAVKNIYCLPLLPNGKPKLDAKPYEVRATGVFNGQSTPKEIIQHLLSRYAGIEYNAFNYNVAEWEAELGGLAEVGVVFDKAVDIFQAIANIQILSGRGFQVYYDYDKFSARLDDNNRPPRLDRSVAIGDIVNINDVEIDMNTDNYATTVQVEYAPNQQAKTTEILTDNRNEWALLSKFKTPKTYTAKTGLKTKEQAQIAADYLIDFFAKTRPQIKGIKLFGVKYFDLKLFDTIEVDLRIAKNNFASGGGRVAKAIEYSERQTLVLRGKSEGIKADELLTISSNGSAGKFRNFGGVFIGKIMNIEIEITTATTTIDVLYLRSGQWKA